MFLFTGSFFIVVVASLFQLSSYAFIGEVKPDIALTLLIILSLVYTGWLERLLLIFVSALILKFGNGLDLQNAVFIISAILSMGIIDRFPFPKLASAIGALLVSTLVINLVHYNAKALLISVPRASVQYRELPYNQSPLRSQLVCSDYHGHRRQQKCLRY